MMRETYIDDNGIEWWKNEGGLLSYAGNERAQSVMLHAQEKDRLRILHNACEHLGIEKSNYSPPVSGMTLRDAFAISVAGDVYRGCVDEDATYKFIAQKIWIMAEAMLAERDK